MRKFIIIALLIIAMPLAASARHHGGSQVSAGVGYGGYAPYYSAYPAYTYYPPQPIYVEPQPIIVEEVQPYDNYARPVTATRYDQGYCREFTRNVKINGRIQQSYGTACQQPDGSWALVN